MLNLKIDKNYKNKLRTYYLYNNILKYIIIYKDNFKLKNKKIKKLLINFNIIKENNFKFIDIFLNVSLFLKLFSTTFCIKNIINGPLNKYFKNYYLNFINPNLIDGIYMIIQFVLRKKKIFIFLEYIVKILIKKNSKKKKYYYLKYLENLNYFFLDITGLLNFKILYLKKKNNLKDNLNFFILFFIINIFFFINND